MPNASYFPTGVTRNPFATLLGFVVGAALQLQQPALWAWPIYAGMVVLAIVLYALAAMKNIAIAGRTPALVLACAVLGVGAAGLRASAYLADALEPALEGRDLRVTGVVANLPQRNEAGLRFRLQVESALLDDQPVRVPPVMDVGWYGGVYANGDVPGDALMGLNRLPEALQAGERWQMTLRLKAPHGSRNPHGFDYELWLWEQGVQATAYVRAGPRDPAAVRLGQTGHYPVALARQLVRDRIFARVAQRQTAGVLAALVVGDQAAIERPDWDVFRATGVAHLVSISGLHARYW